MMHFDFGNNTGKDTEEAINFKNSIYLAWSRLGTSSEGYLVSRETHTLEPDDEELFENSLYEFGSACVRLPSTSPQEIRKAVKNPVS